MNFIFVSPHFPHTYEEFCIRLKENGVNVLGLADAPFDALSPALRDCLTEYFRVDNMESYDQMFKAVAFLTYRHGKIDWIESNNEYWLQQDARLRTDFNVTTGIKSDHIDAFKEKSQMKRYYQLGGIPTARQLRAAEGRERAREFADAVGYPLIVKPDNGVGAGNTYKIHSPEELDRFFASTPDSAAYVIEEFVTGDLYSYDAIIDSHGDPIFESMTLWPVKIMDVVNKHLDLHYYVAPTVDEGLREAGRRTVKAFGVFSRFVHLEFFRLDRDREGLGRQGDYVGLEVNMRPAGGYTPDMMNYAHATDVYKIWADMVAYDSTLMGALDPAKQQYCCYASRRADQPYVNTHEQILQRFGEEIVMCEPIPAVLSEAMGNQMYMLRTPSAERRDEFINFVQQKAEKAGI